MWRCTLMVLILLGTTSTLARGDVFVEQIDVRPVLNADVVVNAPAGELGRLDTSQTLLPDTSLVTHTALKLLHRQAADVALPDDATFPETDRHPLVRLHWHNDEDPLTGTNARVVPAGAAGPATAFTFQTSRRAYRQLQLFATSAEGATDLRITLQYRDGSATQERVTIPEWRTKPALVGGNVFLLAGSRAHVAPNGGAPAATGVHLWGVDLHVAPDRRLASITIEKLTSSDADAHFVFLGAVAVAEEDELARHVAAAAAGGFGGSMRGAGPVRPFGARPVGTASTGSAAGTPSVLTEPPFFPFFPNVIDPPGSGIPNGGTGGGGGGGGGGAGNPPNTPVPEPATVALLAAGVILLLRRERR